jgi:hypothetical protein
LSNIYNTRQDSKANVQAVTAYLTQAVSAIQQVAAKKRDETRANDPTAGAGTARPGYADPRVGQDLASQLKLDLGAFKQALGKEVVRPTGSPKLDGLLKAAGVI